MHTIAAKAVAFGEALQPEFKDYAEQIVKNAKRLAEELQKRGFKLVTGGTSNHLILADIHSSFGIDGKEAEIAMDKIGLTLNANAIPDDPLPRFSQRHSPRHASCHGREAPKKTTWKNRGMDEAVK